MARVFINGFEDGSMQGWTGGGTIISDADKITGNYSLKNVKGGAGSLSSYKVFSALNEIWLSFRCWCDSLNHGWYQYSTWCYPLIIKSGATELCSLSFDCYSTSDLKLHSTFGTTFHTYGFWNTMSIMLRFKPHASAGIFQMYVNGLLEVDFSGQTHASITSCDTLEIKAVGTAFGGGTVMAHDDFILDNAQYPGTGKIAGLAITGAGNSAQWTPSAGSNYQCVDEIPPSDSDFVTATAVDKLDTYALSDLPAEADTVRSVKVMTRGRRGTDSPPIQIKHVVRVNGTDYPGAAQTMPTEYGYQETIWETSPDTSQQWTIPEVNGMEAGIKSA